MNRLVLPVLFLLSAFPFVSSAQQNFIGQQQQSTSASSSSTTQPVLTPLQTAELRADILVARKLYPEAISSYERLVKQEPDNAVVMNKLGVACEVWGANGCAEKYFKKAIKADRNYASPLNNLGTVEYVKKHYKNAIKWYDKSLQLRMDTPATVYVNLGYAYFGDKQYPQAMSAFQQAVAIDPQALQNPGGFGSVVEERSTTDPGQLYFLVARTYAQLGDAERAAHYLKMSRDDGYKKFTSAKTDPAFSKVINDPAVQQVFVPVPELAQNPR